MAINFPIHFSIDPVLNNYWNNVFYWPLRLTMMIIILYFIWRWNDSEQPFYGMSTQKINWNPYLIMLMLMLPLIAIASTQPDFLATYPKLQQVAGAVATHQFDSPKALLFELAYGSDFVSIELFFRGFLVLAFIKWAGKDAILPMACYYCTIHFGKPLGECVSSFPGGILLGVIVFYTRSIWGGLMVHLGIAWLMEAAGYFHPFV